MPGWSSIWMWMLGNCSTSSSFRPLSSFSFVNAVRILALVGLVVGIEDHRDDPDLGCCADLFFRTPSPPPIATMLYRRTETAEHFGDLGEVPLRTPRVALST